MFVICRKFPETLQQQEVCGEEICSRNLQQSHCVESEESSPEPIDGRGGQPQALDKSPSYKTQPGNQRRNDQDGERGDRDLEAQLRRGGTSLRAGLSQIDRPWVAHFGTAAVQCAMSSRHRCGGQYQRLINVKVVSANVRQATNRPDESRG